MLLSAQRHFEWAASVGLRELLVSLQDAVIFECLGRSSMIGEKKISSIFKKGQKNDLGNYRWVSSHFGAWEDRGGSPPRTHFWAHEGEGDWEQPTLIY